MKEPGSPSSPLATMNLGEPGARAASCNFFPVGNAAPPRPRSPDASTASTTCSGELHSPRRPVYSGCASRVDPLLDPSVHDRIGRDTVRIDGGAGCGRGPPVRIRSPSPRASWARYSRPPSSPPARDRNSPGSTCRGTGSASANSRSTSPPPESTHDVPVQTRIAFGLTLESSYDETVPTHRRDRERHAVAPVRRPPPD